MSSQLAPDHDGTGRRALVPMQRKLQECSIWDNDIEINEFNGRATSPSIWPNIRVVDDFTVADASNLIRFTTRNIEDPGWVPGTIQTTYIYGDVGSRPGTTPLHAIDASFVRTSLGETFFGRPAFEYEAVFDPPISLDAGKYWIGFRMPNASSGTSFWMTSDGGVGTEGTDNTGWLSFDVGATWE